MPKAAQLLSKPQDIAWLFETHLKEINDEGLALAKCKSFIIVGNEDSPSLIELYDRKDFNVGYRPFFVWKESLDKCQH